MAKKTKVEEGGQKPAQQSGVLAGHLRRSIEGCGLSQYEIAQRAKIAPQQIYRFMNDGKTLTLETVDKILLITDEGFGLKIMGVEHGRNEMGRVRQDMLGYIGQLQDAIEDLKAIVLHGPVKDSQ